jgi:hypothetical protein
MRAYVNLASFRLTVTWLAMVLFGTVTFRPSPARIMVYPRLRLSTQRKDWIKPWLRRA